MGTPIGCDCQLDSPELTRWLVRHAIWGCAQGQPQFVKQLAPRYSR